MHTLHACDGVLRRSLRNCPSSAPGKKKEASFYSMKNILVHMIDNEDWIDHDGDLILVNTALGRVEQKQATNGKPVSIAIADQNNMYDRVSIQGQVDDQTRARAHAP